MLNHALRVLMLLSVGLAQCFDFKLATLYIPVLALAAFGLFIIQSHITHHCFCTLHLYISCQIPISFVRAQMVVLDQRAFAKRCRANICLSLEVRRPSLMARGVKIIFQVNSALTRMAGYLRLQVLFHLLIFHAERLVHLHFVNTLNSVHLGGIFDIRCIGSDHHVDLVHLRIGRRDAIPVTSCTWCGSRLAALLFVDLSRGGGTSTGLAGEARRASVRDADELPRLWPLARAATDDAIKGVIPAALELDDIAALELAHVRVRERVLAELGHGRDKVLQVVLLLELLLRDQVVVVDQRRVHERVCARRLC